MVYTKSGEGYNLTDQHVIDAKGKIENLEREQQAVLVEEYWIKEYGAAFVAAYKEPISRAKAHLPV